MKNDVTYRGLPRPEGSHISYVEYMVSAIVPYFITRCIRT